MLAASQAVVGQTVQQFQGRVQLDAAAAFERPQEIRLRVTLVNSGPDCRPVLVDPFFFPSRDPGRPLLVVQLRVRSQAGKYLKGQPRPIPTLAGLAASKLLYLKCGETWGEEFSPDPWGYVFARGTYSAQVSVTSRIASFVAKRPTLRAMLPSALGLGDPAIDEALRNWTAESNEATFEVRDDNP